MMLFFGRLDAEKGWTKQLHLGALRNNNTRLLPRDSARTRASTPSATVRRRPRSGAYLDRLDQEKALPKTIIYNLNPADNYVFATMLGNFQDGRIAGKMQFGSGWWFLDQKEAMEWQINALSNLGLLSRFRGHGDGFALFHVLPAARVFPAGAVQPDRPGYGERRDAE